MLDKDGFEDWAAEYDAAVDRAQSAGEYPFCAYNAVHERVLELLAGKVRVLDLGVGTARLTSRLYDAGAQITGVDFSDNMLAAARAKMPSARLIRADLAHGFPAELDRCTFDAAISLYAIHHLTDAQKAALIRGALSHMNGGVFIIGDVAFADEGDRRYCKERAAGAWDDEEYYCVFDKLRHLLPGKARFEKISFCAGVIVIEG